jgi:translation initiation factor 1
MRPPRRRSGADRGLVWDSAVGSTCPGCGAAPAACTCPAAAATAPAGDGIVRIALDRKGRRGKAATLISGLPLTGDELANLAKELKKRCGTGGSVVDGVIEIQGDQRQALVELLSQRGYRVKRVGG